MLKKLIPIVLLVAAFPAVCLASVVDSTEADRLFRQGKYKEAREAYVALVEQFGASSKDSDDYKSYRELAYLYDRLADCCFTQRDFEGLKLYMDGMLEVTQAERNLVESQLAGALASGVARATASYLFDRADESVRLSSLAQIKRSIALLLLDSKGERRVGDSAIKQYQLLAQACVGVLSTDEGYFQINVSRLEQKIDDFDVILDEVERLGDIDALWEKYPPPGAQSYQRSSGNQGD